MKRVQTNVSETASELEAAGHLILRYGLVLVVDVVLLGAAVWSLGEALINIDLDWRI